MVNKRRVLKIVLLVLMAATLGFIFVNSCLPSDVSSAESDAVGGFIASIFPEDTWMYEFLSNNIRKLAHFSEFGAFGAEIAIYVFLFFEDTRRAVLLSLPIPFFAGFFDETIQIFSGRGPMISDVWIDVFGYFTFFAVCLVIMTVADRLKRKNKHDTEK